MAADDSKSRRVDAWDGIPSERASGQEVKVAALLLAQQETRDNIYRQNQQPRNAATHIQGSLWKLEFLPSLK